MKTCDILLEPAKRRAIIEIVGATTIPCLTLGFNELSEHADWDPDFDILILIGEGSNLESFTLQAMQTLQAFMLNWNAVNRTGQHPRTAIACPDDLKRVIAQLWAAMNDPDSWPIEIGVFVTRHQAAAWLAQPPGETQIPGQDRPAIPDSGPVRRPQ